MPERRIHRKELRKKLKEDEVAVFVGELRQSIGRYWSHYGRLTFWSLLAVVLLTGVMTLWSWTQSANFATAQYIFSQAMNQLNNADYTAAESSFTELIERFGNQECVPAALSMRAFCRHKLKDYNGALADYQAALERSTDDNAKRLYHISIAQCYRSLGQPEDAAKQLESLREEVSGGAMRDQITYLLARCKEDLNQPDQALTLYKEISDGSQFKRLVRERISWLETEPVPPINPVPPSPAPQAPAEP